MKHYLFKELESGERFLVGADELSDAREIAYDVCNKIILKNRLETYKLFWICRLTDEEAEAIGLDEY